MSEIKRIIYTPSYCCWGDLTMMKMAVVTITRTKIKFSIKPLEEESFYNPRIDISYDVYAIDDELRYSHGMIWALIDETIESLEKGAKVHMCDAIPASLVVEYSDGKKRVFEDIPYDEIGILVQSINELEPKAFKALYGTIH